MRKLFSILMAISMSLSLSSASISAEASTLIKIRNYTELSDPYVILELAMNQYKDNTKSISAANNGSLIMQSYGDYSDPNSISDDEIMFTQLIEEHAYPNGEMEKKYAITSLLVVDENNDKVGMSQLVATGAEITQNGSITSSGGKYNLAVSCTAYWTWKYDGISTYGRCDYTTNQVVGNTGGQYYVTNLDCIFRSCDEPALSPIYIDHVYFYNPASYVTYTANNPRTAFIHNTPFYNIIEAGVVITYNDGATHEVYIDVKASINKWNPEY